MAKKVLPILCLFVVCLSCDGGQTCAAGSTDCNGRCVDLNSDPQNCGQCGNVCTGGLPCNNGVCGGGCTEETCNGLDDDCDSQIDEDLVENCSNPCGEGTRRCVDGSWTACSAPEPADEVCDGRDNDCDGAIDEETGGRYYRDNDGDTYGDAGSFVQACEAPSGYVDNADDCNDESNAVHPGATEACNGIDDNCNGTPDEGCACTTGETQSCGDWGDEGECELGTQECGEDGTWGDCTGGVMPEEEECDGLDNDCDGEPDDGLPADAYEENDTCELPRDLETASEMSPDDTPLEISDGSLYLTEGGADVDWYRIYADEATHICVPFTGQCCYHFLIALTPPEGSDHADFSMCLYQGGEECTSFENEWCTSSSDWDSGSGAYVMALCWSGTCTLDDGKTFYVAIEGATAAVSNCKPYTLTYLFYSSEDPCE